MFDFLFHLRKFHPKKKFNNWELSIDHLQFFGFIINQIKKSFQFEIEYICALSFHLLSLYSEPPYINKNEFLKIQERLFLENGKGFNSLTSFLICCSLVKIHPFSKISNEIKNKICILMYQFQEIKQLNHLFLNNLIYPLCILSKFSYIARPYEITLKLIKNRFEEEFEIDDDQDTWEMVQNYQLEFEVRSIILLCSGEFVKKGIKFDQIRKLFTSNISLITKTVF